MIYDESIHVPVRGAANRSKGLSYTTHRNGEPRHLIATRANGKIRRFPILAVLDRQAKPKTAYHEPGAYRFVVLRSDLAAAEMFTAE